MQSSQTLCPSAPSYSKAPAGVQQGCGRLPQKPLLELNVSVPSHGLPAPVGLDSLVRYPGREHCCCAAPAERVGGVAAVQARFCAKALEPVVEVGVVEVEDVGCRCWRRRGGHDACQCLHWAENVIALADADFHWTGVSLAEGYGYPDAPLAEGDVD